MKVVNGTPEAQICEGVRRKGPCDGTPARTPEPGRPEGRQLRSPSKRLAHQLIASALAVSSGIAMIAERSVAVHAQATAASPSSPAPATATPAPGEPLPSTLDSRPSFAEWLEGVRAEAVARGIRKEVADQALANIDEPLPVVIERDRTQAETVLSIETYLNRQITSRRIRTGREMMARHKATLDTVAATYGVPTRIIGGIGA